MDANYYEMLMNCLRFRSGHALTALSDYFSKKINAGTELIRVNSCPFAVKNEAGAAT